MSGISEVIASEIADFFAGFGGPGEPDIQSGEAQRLLTERLLSVLALRERAEPVSWDDMPFTCEQLEGMHGADFANGYVRGWERKCASIEMKGPLYTAPPAPVVPTFDEWLEISGNKPLGWVKDAMRESYDACRAAMLAAPGKQPLSVDVLAGALRNAPQAPSDNQGRQRVPIADGWIACSERMPPRIADTCIEYLVYESLNNRVQHDYWNVPEDKERFQAFWNHYGDYVTHWMPLPEAPGKEG
ncbi:DUF551 domain-containing protein [Cronobacter dublinensis]